MTLTPLNVCEEIMNASVQKNGSTGGAMVLGVLLCAGLIGLGWFISGGIVKLRALERTVTVKGLSEREVPADIVIWPIKFSEAGNDLNQLAAVIESKNGMIAEFLRQRGFSDEEISVSVPSIVDRQAQGWTEVDRGLRYSGSSTITVYTGAVDRVLAAMRDVVELGKAGIAVAGQDYEARTEFLYTRLNDLKPGMIEEATRNAREVAEKFAQDSRSRLGRIRTASQGQFSIDNRDSSTPHIKRVRVVSTIEYYLSD
jgi:hypothetical protein